MQIGLDAVGFGQLQGIGGAESVQDEMTVVTDSRDEDTYRANLYLISIKVLFGES